MYCKISGVLQVNTLGERGSNDKKVCEFVHFNVFESQKPSKDIEIHS